MLVRMLAAAEFIDTLRVAAVVPDALNTSGFVALLEAPWVIDQIVPVVPVSIVRAPTEILFV
jgi:hypothetical protein